ncbi:hypothetical protein H6G96_36135 [Nostoc sp. FACHB-892]|uniref:hypothetical protein n=1 Tax=Nostoc sp. FACHB-892 TaxID=2692843 RepID=UPI0016831732|nr:hypothetical protein [Nostoc sp. FACHB-892]MBD2731571.1 hypothetical protein [Nostoc sp. FACHB-892]
MQTSWVYHLAVLIFLEAGLVPECLCWANLLKESGWFLTNRLLHLFSRENPVDACGRFFLGMTISSTLIDPCSVGSMWLRSPNPLDGRFQFSLTANSMPTTLEQAMNVNSRVGSFVFCTVTFRSLNADRSRRN